MKIMSENIERIFMLRKVYFCTGIFFSEIYWPNFKEIRQMALGMIKSASNQKTYDPLKNQLFNAYNFAL